MPTDFNINLAKDMAGPPERRARFYHGMLVYLAISSGVLILTAYFSSVNIQHYITNKMEQRGLIRTTAAVSGLDVSAFRNPDAAYEELLVYSQHLSALKRALGQRVHLLPLLNSLFSELPEGTALQSLSANRNKLSFGLVMPPLSDDSRDTVKELTEVWENNSELMERVASIRPITGERRTVENTPVFYVQFECVLNQ